MDYTASFSTNELIDYDMHYLWHPFTQMKEWSGQDPVFILEGEGNYLIDIKGNRYLDGVSSLWANIHGHAREEINSAIEHQLKKISHSTLLGLTHPLAAILAMRLSDIAPGNHRWSFYSEAGSTAVEIAVKMAFQYWQNIGMKGKKRFLGLKEGYHGDTIGSVSVGGIDLFHEIYSPLLFESFKAPSPYLYCREKGIPLEEGAEACAMTVKDILEKYHTEICAFILEPIVQGAGGILPFPPGYLKRVSELCRHYDVLLIADEVAVGFGRTGKMFACEQEGVEPDFLCLGKGLTGGYLPLAVTLVADHVFNSFWDDYERQKTFYHGHTYTGNPLGCVAGLASLDLFEKDRIFEYLPEKIIRLEKGLQRLSMLEAVGEVRNRGFMAAVEIFQNSKTKQPYPVAQRMGHKVCMAVRKYGVILRNLGDAIVLMPPLSITLEQLDHIIESAEKAIREICR